MGIGLENGYLKLVWSFHKDNDTYGTKESDTILENSRTTTRVLPHAGFVSDGEWHVIKLRMDKANVTFLVDQLVAYVEEPGLTGVEEYVDIDLFLGKYLRQQEKYLLLCVPIWYLLRLHNKNKFTAST